MAYCILTPASQGHACLEDGYFRIPGAFVADFGPGSRRQDEVNEFVIRLYRRLAVHDDSGIEVYPPGLL